MELNQNGQIEVEECPNTSAIITSSTDDADGNGAAVLSIHEQTNGNLSQINGNNNTSLNGDPTPNDTSKSAIDVAQKENGINNSINADATAVGLTTKNKTHTTPHIKILQKFRKENQNQLAVIYINSKAIYSQSFMTILIYYLIFVVYCFTYIIVITSLKTKINRAVFSYIVFIF